MRARAVAALRVIGTWTLALLVACTAPGEPPSDDDDSAAAERSSVEESALPPCDSPAPSPGAFLDGSPASGITFVHDADYTLPAGAHPTLADFLHEVTAGVVAADFDADGAPDLFFPQLVGVAHLYWGRGDGTFQRADEDSGIAAVADFAVGASAADYDGDGLLDLVVGSLDRIQILQNRGDRSFIDRTDELGIASVVGITSHMSWADVDQDGDLDLYVCRNVESGTVFSGFTSSVDALWRNDGDAFTEVTEAVHPAGTDTGACLFSSFHDLDHDGDLDLLQINDFSEIHVNSRILENVGGEGAIAFVDRWSDADLGVLLFPMGAAVRDLDGDGDPDLWLSNLGTPYAYRSLGAWGWVDVSLSWAGDLPSTRPWSSWSVVDLDLDGDGRPGILITYGPLLPDEGDEGNPNPLVELEQPDLFLVSEGEGETLTFHPDPSVMPSPRIGSSRGLAVADFDGNGVPDVIIGHVDAGPSLLLARCTSAHRLVVELRDPTTANVFGIGARVSVEAGGARQVQQMMAGGRGTFSGSDPVLFFGLGDATEVDTLEVRWPDGIVEEVDLGCSHCRATITRAAR